MSLVSQNSVQQKWGYNVTTGDTGFVSVPDMLFKSQGYLDIDNTELVVLLNIALHWWKVGEWPHPRLSSIAKRMGCSKRTVERSVKSLQEKNLIERLPSQQKITADGVITVRYIELTGLVNLLDKLASIQQKRNSIIAA